LLATSLANAQEAPAAAKPKPPAGLAEYEFGILRRGTSSADDSAAEKERRQRGHLENMERMAAAGLLVGAGPIADQGEVRGIFIFVPGQRARLDEMVKADPALSSGRLTLELHPWWGPAGIGEAYFAEHKANPAAKDRMTRYFLAFLMAGPNRGNAGAPEAQKIQEAHMAHIRALSDTGKLIAAGPFLDDGTLRGIFLFKTATLEEAQALASEDPAVKAGRLAVEIHPWMVAEGVIPEKK
jgi:uncharacterized protein YciI